MMTKQGRKPTMLSVKDVAAELQLTPRTARALILSDVRHTLVGDPKRPQVRVTREALDAYLEERTTDPTVATVTPLAAPSPAPTGRRRRRESA